MRSLLLDAGSLRHELVLQSATLLPDGLGGHAESWSERRCSG